MCYQDHLINIISFLFSKHTHLIGTSTLLPHPSHTLPPLCRALATILKVPVIFERVPIQNGLLKITLNGPNCNFLPVKNVSYLLKWLAWQVQAKTLPLCSVWTVRSNPLSYHLNGQLLDSLRWSSTWLPPSPTHKQSHLTTTIMQNLPKHCIHFGLILSNALLAGIRQLNLYVPWYVCRVRHS